jgi:hypothetical protein
MEDLFNIIGKLYVDVYNSQKVIEILQKQLKDKENEIVKQYSSKENDE